MPKIASLGGMSSRGFGEFARQAAGAYIEDVFSTYLYNGTDAPQTITNGIDLSGNGGLVWLKSRSGTVVTGYDKHILFDTVRTNTNSLSTNSTAAVESGWSNAFFRFRADGFDFGTSTSTADQSYLNNLGVSYASWTFGKKQKFFDIVSYTGNATARDITHSLGSTPGFIIIKRRDAVAQWPTWHRSLPANNVIFLNQTTATQTISGYVTAVSSTTFSIGTQNTLNANGGSFIAYLFAHDAGGFGADGSQNVISCGSFTTDASGNATVSLGYEPQFVMFKASSTTGSWRMYDNMRGIATGGTDAVLYANLTSAEDTSANAIDLNATGFSISGQTASTDHIYLAIRRGPMRTPTSGTSVFAPISSAATTANAVQTSGFPVDWIIAKQKNGTSPPTGGTRLLGGSFLTTNTTDAETAWDYIRFDNNTGYYVTTTGTYFNSSSTVNWMLGRAPGFFDVLCYTGTGSARTVNHNLGVAPELIIIKSRSNVLNWRTFSNFGTTNYRRGVLDNNTLVSLVNYADDFGISSAPTSSGIPVGTNVVSNASGYTYVAYLFASCPGVSKVGSYTGTGATQTISCGFTGGARYVLIKRTDSTGDWWVWDTARGMVAGTDPRLAYNSTAAETNANWVYTTTGGFQIVTSDATVNASGGSYIFLAIA